MRLKILFFPLMLVITISIGLLRAWPAYLEFNTKREELKNGSQELESAFKKKEALQVLSRDLEVNKEKREKIYAFFPVNKYEERAIDRLNFLAANSGVAVSNITVSSEASSDSIEDTEKEFWGGFSFLGVKSKNQQNNSAKASAGKAQTVVSGISGVQSGLVVTVAGDYDKLKMYLKELQALDLLCQIESMEISKSQANSGDQNNAAGILNMKVKVVFFSAPLVKNGQQVAEAVVARGQNDYSVLDKLSKSVNQELPELETGVGGRANPFLAQ